MIFLSIFYLFLSCIILINSECSRKTPRKEGFIRHTCTPGFYNGSCLIILPKMTLTAATETCRYDYGGRLAGAPPEAIQIWIRTIHFYTKEKFDDNSRFWIGHAKNGMDETMSKYIDEEMWYVF
uniref:C-type lectin domain-containing protein n=1 Tax=Panagrolaimus davidi TaxID=227884 RepID=A0A914PM36_9BILA